MFRSAGCSHLRAKVFSCILDVLYGDLGISKLQIFIKKYKFFFFSFNFFHFWPSKPWIRIPASIQPKMLDPDP
jgi:hypothetical protein